MVNSSWRASFFQQPASDLRRGSLSPTDRFYTRVPWRKATRQREIRNEELERTKDRPEREQRPAQKRYGARDGGRLRPGMSVEPTIDTRPVSFASSSGRAS